MYVSMYAYTYYVYAYILTYIDIFLMYDSLMHHKLTSTCALVRQ